MGLLLWVWMENVRLISRLCVLWDIYLLLQQRCHQVPRRLDEYCTYNPQLQDPHPAQGLLLQPGRGCRSQAQGNNRFLYEITAEDNTSKTNLGGPCVPLGVTQTQMNSLACCRHVLMWQHNNPIFRWSTFPKRQTCPWKDALHMGQ